MVSKMYRQPPKRKQLLQRVIIYSAMSLAVVTLVSVLVFFMLGYQFNRNAGTIEQGGLVQFNTSPSGAEVIIDGKNLGTRTPSRKTMVAGQHFISMERTGYKAWQKSIEVMPGTVLWLTYARLVPNELDPVNVADFDTVTSTAASPNRQQFAIKTDASLPQFRLADLTRDDVELETITLPAGSYTAPAPEMTQSFTLVEWDASSRYILMKHVYDDSKVEWIVADTQDIDNTKNVTTLLGVNLTKLVFKDNDPSILYALIDGNIRRINLNAETLSGPLVSNIAEFSVFDNTTITYVTKRDPATNMRSVGYLSEGANKPRTIRAYSDKMDVPLRLAMGKYFSDVYIALAYDETVEIMKGPLPRSDSKDPSAFTAVSTMAIPGGAQSLSIRTNGRFVMAQSANGYVVHDIELDKTTSTVVKGATASSREPRWIDPYTIWSDLNGTLRLYEFDGANQHDIMPVAPGFSATYSPSAKYMYSIAKSKDGEFHLQRVLMVLP